MSETFTYEDKITLEVLRCPVCAVPYGVEKRMLQSRRENGNEWHCPNGHTLVFTGETITDKLLRLEREHKSLKESKNWWRNEAEKTARSLSATKGVLTRTKNRIAKGICPCCNRQFVNLQRHMETQHPEYLQDDIRLYE